MLGPGSLQGLLRPLHAVVQHPVRVLAHRVLDLRRRDTVRVGQVRVKSDAVVFFRQVFGHYGDTQGVTEPFVEHLVVVPSPRDFLSQQTAQGGGQRGAAEGQHLQVVAADEAPAGVGLVELLAQHGAAPWPAVFRAQPLVEHPDHHPGRVMHQVLSDQAGAVGEAVGEQAGGGVEKQPGSADAVAGHHHGLGFLLQKVPVGVVIQHARGPAGIVDQNLPHPGVGLEPGAQLERLRPEDKIGAGQGTQITAGIGLPPIVGDRGYGGIRSPPVPAQLVEPLGQQLAAGAYR